MIHLIQRTADVYDGHRVERVSAVLDDVAYADRGLAQERADALNAMEIENFRPHYDKELAAFEREQETRSRMGAALAGVEGHRWVLDQALSKKHPGDFEQWVARRSDNDHVTYEVIDVEVLR